MVKMRRVTVKKDGKWVTMLKPVGKPSSSNGSSNNNTLPSTNLSKPTPKRKATVGYQSSTSTARQTTTYRAPVAYRAPVKPKESLTSIEKESLTSIEKESLTSIEKESLTSIEKESLTSIEPVKSKESITSIEAVKPKESLTSIEISIETVKPPLAQGGDRVQEPCTWRSAQPEGSPISTRDDTGDTLSGVSNKRSQGARANAKKSWSDAFSHSDEDEDDEDDEDNLVTRDRAWHRAKRRVNISSSLSEESDQEAGAGDATGDSPSKDNASEVHSGVMDAKETPGVRGDVAVNTNMPENTDLENTTMLGLKTMLKASAAAYQKETAPVAPLPKKFASVFRRGKRCTIIVNGLPIAGTFYAKGCEPVCRDCYQDMVAPLLNKAAGESSEHT